MSKALALCAASLASPVAAEPIYQRYVEANCTAYVAYANAPDLLQSDAAVFFEGLTYGLAQGRGTRDIQNQIAAACAEDPTLNVRDAMRQTFDARH